MIDLKDNSVVHLLDMEQWVAGLAFSPDGSRLAVSLSTVSPQGDKFRDKKMGSGVVAIYEVPSLKELARTEPAPQLGEVVFSADGTMLFVACSSLHFADGFVQVLSIPNLEKIAATETVLRLPKVVYDSADDELLIARPGLSEDDVIVADAKSGKRREFTNRNITSRLVLVGKDGNGLLDYENSALSCPLSKRGDCKWIHFEKGMRTLSARCLDYFAGTDEVLAGVSSDDRRQAFSTAFVVELANDRRIAVLESNTFFISAVKFGADNGICAIGTALHRQADNRMSGHVVLCRKK